VIVVIADDISGAAELAGVAFERGFTAEVQTRFDPDSDAEVVALDTDSRLLAPEEAAARVGAIAREVADSEPTLIYKKTDSVLRGAIVPEIDAIMEAAGMPRALLVPANPSRGRVIRGGEYFVNGVALAETEFANDPTHPAWTSNALELLGPSKRGGTSSVRSSDAMFGSGVTVPDVESAEDLKRRAAEVKVGILPAGGAEFFGAVLDACSESSIEGSPLTPALSPTGACLLVCGSAAAWSAGRKAQATRRGMCCVVMPKTLELAAHDDVMAESFVHQWAGGVCGAMEECGVAMVAIGRSDLLSAQPETLSKRLAEVVALTFRMTEVDRLLLEGGATARAVIDTMGWSRFETVGAIEGLSWLRPAEGGPVLLIKPGSYDWPDAV